MSLLDAAGLMTGDIWLSGTFNFDSPLKDLLDSEEYTLEQLLSEDELLQELRGVHPQLIDVLETEKAVTALVKYVILPPLAPQPTPLFLSHKKKEEAAKDGEGEGDEKPKEEKKAKKDKKGKKEDATKPKSEQEEKDDLYIRYPYMACEVICCEIKGIVDTIVDGFVPEGMGSANEDGPRPQRILDLLFSVLYDAEVGQFDDYRAGYFDKVLSVLFRKRPQALGDYINDGGGRGDTVLMNAMMKHLYSHSLMQIVQRLLLPQPPLPEKDEDGNPIDDLYGDPLDVADMDGMDLFRCTWPESDVALDLLLDALAGTDDEEVVTNDPELEERLLNQYLNASEVLITIIQNSPLTSPTLKVLTTDPVMKRLMIAASSIKEGATFSPHDSRVTCAMNVLESLILQLGGYGSVGLMFPEEEEEGQEGFNDQEPPYDMATTETLIEHLPMMLSNLANLLKYPESDHWVSPMQFARSEPQKLLGSSRLRIVRLLESLVLLGDPGVDALLCSSNCMEICLDLFWMFQWCSMLHQSVANLLVHVFEGQNARSELQTYFIKDCNLLGRLMDSFWAGGKGAGSDTKLSEAVMAMKGSGLPSSSVVSEAGSSPEVAPVSDDDVQASLENKIEEKVNEETDEADKPRSELVEHAPAQSFRLGYMGHVIIICQALVHACTNADANSADPSIEGENLEGDHEAGEGAGSADGEHGDRMEVDNGPLILAELVDTHELNERWQDFVTTTLASETAIQSTPLGGFQGSPLGNDLHQQHPGMVDDGDYGDEEGGAPSLPARGLLVGGDTIDMDDNDLDVAASMIAGLNIRRDGDGDGADSNNARGYQFDDPLGDGRFGKFDDDGDSSSDEESGETDNTGGSGGAAGDGAAPPVMDLFAGNFDLANQNNDQETPKEFGNFDDAFANFDDAFAGANGDSTDGGSGFPSTPNSDAADLFGERKDHVELLDMGESPEKEFDNDDDGSHSSASSSEEPAKPEDDEPAS
mmetsp:Transcript_41910/g.100986  ORF Transcript_41910/g.100986 Transcript_41910/m.100986 type:complete len:984 (+) Transcript_41910:262-3213(+)|eukprot:CAMPEP_0113613762 /NCGR_PEP_ID=MMETSP0017_2-20120614/6812_1 /TAXON_ID=2856 /ORGANISM="Cylindrotheca closterium" /LENGTH=983 /DNA_ID=CAMNT_0000522897 /DNA_START=139 /DNA_END=3090 /DNA_ORIENTATION=- /assembly_acc=CAM_ASM_000147